MIGGWKTQKCRGRFHFFKRYKGKLPKAKTKVKSEAEGFVEVELDDPDLPF